MGRITAGSWQGEIQLWQGEEIEFALTSQDPTNFQKTYVPELILALGEQNLCLRLGNVPSEYLWNGGRAYADEIVNFGGGKHRIFEIATPECPSAYQTTLYDRAAERIAVLAATGAGREIHCYKTSLAEAKGSYTTRGCHESYLVSKSILDKLELLKPYLVIRQIFCGAGGYYQNSFVLSPRQVFIEKTISPLSYPTPMVFCRHESHAAPDEFRLQILNGEGTRSEVSTFLRFGVTASIIRCLQEGLITDLPAIENPLATSKEMSTRWAKGWMLRLASGKTISALQYFLAYLLPPLEKLFREGEPTKEDFKVWEWLKETLLALEKGDLDCLAGYLDWAIKLRYLENEDSFSQLFDLGLENDENMGIKQQQKAVNYSYTAVTENTYETLKDSLGLKGLFHEEEVEHAVWVPPDRSRGQLRNRIGREFGPYLEDLNWDGIVMGGKKDYWEQLCWPEGEIEGKVKDLRHLIEEMKVPKLGG